MKRSGFTMIELIFVIVILGILAAVAIPKLAATRDDAKSAAEMTSVAQSLQNLGSEFTSKGAFTNFTEADADAAVKCFDFATTADGNVTVTSQADDATSCPATLLAATKLKATNGILGAAGAAKVHTFGGTSIVQ